ncbi:MAG: hypothetical protein ACKOX7_05270 [Bacteroidota bacterium]
MFLWLPFVSIAQDTIVYWGGHKKAVFITRMDKLKVRYKNSLGSNSEKSIQKDNIMHICSADSTNQWEQVIYGPEAYGLLPNTTKGIDSLAYEHVLRFYQGDHVVGSKTFFASILGTPAFGLAYAMRQSVKPIEQDKLGMMGNPHQSNPEYLSSFIKHAREQNRKRIFANVVVGSVVVSIPLGLAVALTRGGF